MASMTASRPVAPETAAEAASKEAAARISDAESSAATGDWLKARETLLKALDLTPTSADLHGRIAFFTFHAGRSGLPEAQRLVAHHINVAREAGPDQPFHYYWSGRLAVAQANPTRARMQFQAALALSPEFEPAKRAIAKLDEPAPGAAAGGVAYRPPAASTRKKSVVVLMLLVFVSGTAAAVYHFMPDMALERLSARLGTKFPIVSASQEPPDLLIEVGPAWNEMPAVERDAEVRAIAERARSMGYISVSIFSGGLVVIELRDGPNCPSTMCVLGEMQRPGPNGSLPIPVQAAPQSP